MSTELPTALIRMRLGQEDAHYGGNLVAGATQLKIIGDLITELAMRQDGDEGLFRAYESVEFLYPLYAGDWIEGRGKIVEVGNTSRRCEFEIWKIGGALTDISESAAEFLAEPILTCRAVGTTVVPKDAQRF
jgi:3-aminobutyryl-CoA ammonia-lyase